MLDCLAPLSGRRSGIKKKLVFDIEASNWTHFEVAGVYDGKTYAKFYTAKDLLEYLLSRKYRGYTLWAHYGGRYDFLFLLPELIKGGYDIEICDAGSRIIFIKVTDKSGHLWTLADSYNIIPAALKVITESFGVEHKKQDFDIGNVKFNKRNMPKIESYLKDDCYGLYEALEKFQDWGLNDGVLKLTVALQAMHVFRSKFLDRVIPCLSRKKEEFIRRGYFGGRVEIFKMCGDGLNMYDVNSLYPYCMTMDMPVGNPINTTRYCSGYIGFYDAVVEYPKRYIPCLPYPVEGKLLFPIGTMRGVFSSCELEAAKKEGAAVRVVRGLYFPDKAPIFNDYVKKIYEIKKNSKKGGIDYLVSKLLGNALYGKFGMHRERTSIITSNISEAYANGYKDYMAELGLYEKETISEATFIIPSLSAWITSLARLFLFNTFKQVGVTNVYYCDTDSIVTDKKIPTGNGLGQWKLEYENVRGVFLQPKFYALQNKNTEIIKAKGFNNPPFTFADYDKALKEWNFEDLQYSYQRNTGWREGIKRYGIPLNRIDTKKHFSQVYGKRKITKKMTTFPLTIGENGAIVK